MAAQAVALAAAQADAPATHSAARAQTEANRAQAATVAAEAAELALEKGRLWTLEGSLAGQASELAGCVRLVQRFERALLQHAALASSSPLASATADFAVTAPCEVCAGSQEN